ncbi:TPA: glycosyltransferase family 2 protein [Vibrio parahaemolyticus]
MRVSNVAPISLVTVSHGHFNYIRELVASMQEHWSSPFEFILIDNLNSDEFDDWVTECNLQLEPAGSRIRLFKFSQPNSFSVGNNFAIRKASHEHLFIINPDCRFIDDSVHKWFSRNSKQIENALCYPLLLNGDGSVQQSFNEWPNLPNQILRLLRAKLGLSTGQKQKRKDWYFASSIITTKKTFWRLNGFEELFPLYCEDVDLCYKARLLEVPCRYIKSVRMIHYLGGEAKHKHLRKAICSNVVWRYVRIRNYVQIKLFKKRYDH